MITSVGLNSDNTLAQILNNLNNINTDKSEGVSKKELGALEEETAFSKSLMECFDAIDTDKNGDVTSTEVTNSTDDILSKLGVPAGLEIETQDNSFLSKLKDKFDFDKDGKLSKNDLTIAENKSPLVKNLMNTFEDVTNSTGGNKVSDFFQGMINQYKDNPINAITDAAKLFA